MSYRSQSLTEFQRRYLPLATRHWVGLTSSALAIVVAGTIGVLLAGLDAAAPVDSDGNRTAARPEASAGLATPQGGLDPLDERSTHLQARDRQLPSPTEAALHGDALTAAPGTRVDLHELILRLNSISASFVGAADSLAENIERLSAVPAIMPTTGHLSSPFSLSRVHPILSIERPHVGIDIRAPASAPVVAPAAGRVVRAGPEPGYGLMVELDHGNGIATRYGHCSRLEVGVGQRVVRGQTIARVGSSGLSTGPHLHYEIRMHGVPVDPLLYARPEPMPR